ncbi:alkaline shock response membrane anchor protein AmaP [Dietzia alimentaria]|uniref:alkaline shock response membrane anchor protein AmaP n=1 Tax=Dietzia alimentaria TaxID=665550 RepID=UPI00029B1B18|nr:alkaline shock response membrane anchor protein AmaP [Dietzia alimentaria]
MSAPATPRRLVRHPARAIPAVLLSIVLLVGGALGLWLLGAYFLHGTVPTEAAGAVTAIADTRLDSIAAQVVAVALAVLGLLMILSALVPGRPSRTRILAGDIPGDTAISRRDLARRIRRRAEQVDGVHSARVEVKRRRTDVVVRTVVDDTEPVLHSARAAVDQAVEELHLARSAPPRVRITRRS